MHTSKDNSKFRVHLNIIYIYTVNLKSDTNKISFEMLLNRVIYKILYRHKKYFTTTNTSTIFF